MSGRTLLLALTVLAACKKDPQVPAEFRPFVPKRGLTQAIPADEANRKLWRLPPGMTLMYDGLAAADLRAGFAGQLGSVDGYQVLIDCDLPAVGFQVSAVRAPNTAVIVTATELGVPTSFKVDLAVSRFEMIGLPADPSCAWTPAAAALCDLSDDPRSCKLPG